MSVWEQVTWTVARAGGFTAYILVALSVALGLALSLRWQSARRWPRLVNSELHNFVTLLSLVFIVVHIVAVWVDPFTRFGWAEVFIPFVSHYRALWMALGIVAFYLGIAVALSTLLRPYIGYEWWHRFHMITLALFGMVTVHGIATGSDTRTWWGLLIYLGAVILVGGLLCVRLLAPVSPRGRAHPVIALACALLVVLGAGWAAAGPLRAGWNEVANNGQGSGARIALASSGTGNTGGSTGSGSSGTNGANGSSGGAAGTVVAGPFTDTVSGTMSQQDGTGDGTTITLNLQATGNVPATVTVTLQGRQDDDGSIALTSTNLTFQPQSGGTYRGELRTLDAGGSRWRMSAVTTDGNSGDQPLIIQLIVRVGDSGAVAGRLAGATTDDAGSQSPQWPQAPSATPQDGNSF